MGPTLKQVELQSSGSQQRDMTADEVVENIFPKGAKYDDVRDKMTEVLRSNSNLEALRFAVNPRGGKIDQGMLNRFAFYIKDPRNYPGNLEQH